jgi:hypothetical protein
VQVFRKIKFDNFENPQLQRQRSPPIFRPPCPQSSEISDMWRSRPLPTTSRRHDPAGPPEADIKGGPKNFRGRISPNVFEISSKWRRRDVVPDPDNGHFELRARRASGSETSPYRKSAHVIAPRVRLESSELFHILRARSRGSYSRTRRVTHECRKPSEASSHVVWLRFWKLSQNVVQPH